MNVKSRNIVRAHPTAVQNMAVGKKDTVFANTAPKIVAPKRRPLSINVESHLWTPGRGNPPQAVDYAQCGEETPGVILTRRIRVEHYCYTLDGGEESLPKGSYHEAQGEDEPSGSKRHQGITSSNDQTGQSKKMEVEHRVPPRILGVVQPSWCPLQYTDHG